MKILVVIPNTEYAFLLDAEHAGSVSKLLADSTLVKSKGWGDTQRWQPVEDASLTFMLCDDKRFDFAPRSARELAAERDAEAASSDRWKEYTARQAAEKRVKELEDQLALVKSMTVCETAPQQPSAGTEYPSDTNDEILL